MTQQAWRLEANPEKLGQDEIYQLFRISLAKYLV